MIKHKDSFSKSSADIGRTDLVDHTINTWDALPIRQRPRRITLAKMEAAEAEIERMAKDGLIEPSTSPWNSPGVMIRKSDLSWRFCLDYRILNNITVKQSQFLPRIDDTLDALSQNKWFSTLDLKSGYHQLNLANEDRPKTAFSLPGEDSGSLLFYHLGYVMPQQFLKN